MLSEKNNFYYELNSKIIKYEVNEMSFNSSIKHPNEDIVRELIKDQLTKKSIL